MEKKVKVAAAVGVIAVACVVLFAAIFLMGSKAPYDGPNSEHIGKYASYSVTGTYDNMPYNGTYKISVIGASPEGIQCQYTLQIPQMPAFNKTETFWVPVNEESSGLFSGMYEDAVSLGTGPVTALGKTWSGASTYMVKLGETEGVKIWVHSGMIFRMDLPLEDNPPIVCTLTATNII